MDVSLETPRLSSKTMLFIEYPRFLLDPQICIENPKLFIGDPRFFFGDPMIFIGYPIFYWKVPDFIGDPQSFF